MVKPLPIRWVDVVGFLLVLAAAAAARGWYVYEWLDNGRADPVLRAQDPPQPLDSAEPILGKQDADRMDLLVHNLAEHNWFGGVGPLSPDEEDTAHVAPGYPFFLSVVYRFSQPDEAPALVRWIQVALGALAAGLSFCFVRRCFRSRAAALLAGLLCAVHPFWVVNVGELHDGTLTVFLLALILSMGARAGEQGGVVVSVLLGLSLAGLALIRAALLPFAVVGLLWFLLRCRVVARGWLYALLALLGFANGLAAWTVHNYQRFGDVIPVADAALVHLWIGNNPSADGGPFTEAQLRASVDESKLGLTSADLLSEPNQHLRYRQLARPLLEFIRQHPEQALRNRLWASLYFFFGKAWFAGADTTVPQRGADDPSAPIDARTRQIMINASLLVLLLLGLLGWRWSHGLTRVGGLAAAAMIWIPLPYILTHGDWLWGPRLPLDVVLLAYIAVAVTKCLPIVGKPLRNTRSK